MQPADLDDVISQAYLDYMLARKSGKGTNALFLVIADRRASDLWRSRKGQLPLTAAGLLVSTPPNREHLEAELLARAVRRFAARNPRLNSQRLLGLLREVLRGVPFATACRAVGIPRGSQIRYRSALRACFKDLPVKVDPSVMLRRANLGGVDESDLTRRSEGLVPSRVVHRSPRR